MSYDEWIQRVIELGRLKGLEVYYYEDLPRWGRRIGHFEAYCRGVLKVWAGAGEDLLGPAVFTSPEAFTEYWPRCEALAVEPEPPAPAPIMGPGWIPPAQLSWYEYRARAGRWVDPNRARVLKRALEALL